MTDATDADDDRDEPTGRTVLVSRDGDLATLTLNRPDRANTLNEQLHDELRAGFLELANDDAVRAIILTANGRHFCGGADLRARRTRPPVNYYFGLDYDWVPKPVIAAINGAAMGGGCELALSCDFRFISSTAQIGLTEIRFGALPAGGGTARLPRIVGLANAKRLIYTGQPVDADEALRIGLVDRVSEPDELLGEATRFASELAVNAPYALRTAKTLLNQSLDLDLHHAMDLERKMIAKMATRDEMAAARAEASERMSTYANIFAKPDEDQA
ncbi:MAG: enoyl-CoA hydratase/isomerase family protein [Actinomycetota bacterium]